MTVVVFYLVYYRPIGRWVVAGAVALTVPLVLGPHIYVLGQLQRRRRRVVFIGGSPLTDRMVQAFAEADRPLCQVVGRWSPDDAHPGNGDDLVELARSRGVDEIACPRPWQGGRDAGPFAAALGSACVRAYVTRHLRAVPCPTFPGVDAAADGKPPIT